MVVSLIETEAELVRDTLRSASNPGKIWENWKTTTKKQLQAVQKKLRVQYSHAVYEACVRLDRATARYRDFSCVLDQELYAYAMQYYKEVVQRTSQYNQDTAFVFQTSHSETHFFWPLDTSLRRDSIEEAVTPGGALSTNPQDISFQFLEHWGSEMGGPDSPSRRPLPPDAILQLTLLNYITSSVSSLERAIVDGSVTDSDLAAAIRHMKASSAPGMDGLTTAFY